jgi:hypothetical protein
MMLRRVTEGKSKQLLVFLRFNGHLLNLYGILFKSYSVIFVYILSN